MQQTETLDQPSLQAKLLEGVCEIYKSPPTALTKLDCGTARAEGVLASSVSAVRNRGDVYSKSVFDALAQESTVDADRLKQTAVTSDGHVIFQ